MNNLKFNFSSVSLVLIFLFFRNITAFAQSGVSYESIPQNWQLFQRDSLNTAVVPIKGKVVLAGYNNISLVVKRDDKAGQIQYYRKILLNYVNGTADFSFSTPITAGLFNYNFDIYLSKGNDSTLIDTRSNIVSGDVILIYGQSNALAFPDIDSYPYGNNFCRVIYVDDFNAKKFTWNYQIEKTAVHIGSFGAELAKQITSKYKIPVCILNGAVGSTSIVQLSDRDSNNPLNASTIYGKFLDYVELGNFAKNAKILIYRQGETEALEGTGSLINLYAAQFDTLYRFWKTDLTGLKKIYSFQNNIYGNYNLRAGELRDFQRKEALIYNNIQSISTVGTVSFDGLHYTTAGYVQSATEVFRMISRDFYGEQNFQNFDSPFIKKAFYNAPKNVITLVFDDNQTLQPAPADSLVGDPKSPAIIWRLKDFIYLDGIGNKISNISTDGNRATLYLTDSSNAKTVTYLPSYYDAYVVSHNYQGLHFKNQLGMRALTFDSFPIAPLMKINNIKTILVGGNSAQMQWDKLTEALPKVIIERANDTAEKFEVIATLINGETSYSDKNLLPQTTYYYRFKAKSALSESDYSEVFSVKTTSFVTALELENADKNNYIFPNPNRINKFYLSKNISCKLLIIKDLSGKSLGVYNSNFSEIDVSSLSTGMYLVEITDSKNNKIIRKLIKE